MGNAKKLVPFVAVPAMELGGQAITDLRKPEFMRGSGSVVGLKVLADRRNLNIKGDAGKANRKALMRELDVARRGQNQFGRQVLGACLADPTMAARKVKFTRSKDGEFTGVDVSMRIDTQAAGHAASDLSRQLKEAQEEVRQLKLRLETPALPVTA